MWEILIAGAGLCLTLMLSMSKASNKIASRLATIEATLQYLGKGFDEFKGVLEEKSRQDLKMHDNITRLNGRVIVLERRQK